MKTLITRTLSGAVYVALIVWAILWNDFAFAAVFAVLAALTTYEFHKLTNKQENVNALAWLGAVCSVLLFVSNFLMHLKNEIEYISSKLFYIAVIMIAIYTFLIFGTFIIEIFRKKSNPIHNIAYVFLGQIYIAIPFVLMFTIYEEFAAILLLSVFVIIWANDSFAYLIGSWLGKHKMCERISPKKSWEGFAGGLIGAFIVVCILFKFLPVEIFNYYNLNLWQWLIFALIIVIFGTLGDLFESLIKRTIGVKDSGNIMPGHGGFLDRLDSVIFAVLPALTFLFFCQFI